MSVCQCVNVSMCQCVCVCVWKCDKHCCGVVPGLGCHLSLLISLINPSQPPFIPSTNININKWHIVDQIILHKFGNFHNSVSDWRIVFKKMFQKNLSSNDYFDSWIEIDAGSLFESRTSLTFLSCQSRSVFHNNVIPLACYCYCNCYCYCYYELLQVLPWP